MTAFSVRTTDFKVWAEAWDPTAIATALTAPIRQNTTVRTSPSKGHRDQLTDRDNGGAAAFFHPSPRRDLNLGFALFAARSQQDHNQNGFGSSCRNGRRYQDRDRRPPPAARHGIAAQ